ncbi:MAG: LuxR C-terminal-related transcriptional regulator [Cyclobacteriaceae bacterium]|nr:LuxR C-terminal-related transcriptional regulator [Cyclobacteriaceae bacterium]
MSQTFEVIDLAKAFGKRDFVILDQRYKTHLAQHPLVRGLWTVGRYFVLVGNMQDLKTEFISGDCTRITGYSCQEIKSLNAQFVMQFSLPPDLAFNLNVVKLAMEYALQIDKAERELIYVVYFFRAKKKDGQVITIQQQSIPIVFDENGVPFIFSNIYTDISYLGVSNIPQAILVNKSTDEIFNIQPQHLKLIKCEELFSRREKEVVQLLINGLNSRQIGEQLFISMETVRTHRKNILKKAGLNSSTELVGYALTHGLV